MSTERCNDSDSTSTGNHHDMYHDHRITHDITPSRCLDLTQCTLTMASKENTNMEERRGGISLPPSTQPARRQVTFWRNGFTFGEGPLMSYEDPKNAAVLQDILSGQVPPTLLDAQPGQLVELAVSKRTNEDYVAEPKEPSDDSEAGVV